jgi:hypothetical protein
VKDEPGFYTITRRSVKEYIAGAAPQESAEDAIVKAALENAGEAAADLRNLGDFSKPREFNKLFSQHTLLTLPSKKSRASSL